MTICLIARFMFQSSHEIRGEPVEQFGMARPFALRAEVVHRLHEPGAEEHRPPAIHRDARGERLLRRDEPVREIEPGERLAVARLRGELREKRGRAGGDLLAVLIVLRRGP